MRTLMIALGIVGLAALVGCAGSPRSVTRSFWQATIDRDFEKARSLATESSQEQLAFLEANWDDTVEIEFDIGTATVEGETATCPMTYSYPQHEGVADGFVTHLVRQDGVWKVDAVRTMKPLVDEYGQAVAVAGRAVQAAMEQLAQELAESIKESFWGKSARPRP
jgi:hypothetical protein